MLVWDNKRQWKKYKKFAKYFPSVFQSIIEAGKCNRGEKKKYYVIIDDSSLIGGGTTKIDQELDQHLSFIVKNMVKSVRESRENYKFIVKKPNFDNNNNQNIQDYIRYDRQNKYAWFVAVPAEWNVETVKLSNLDKISNGMDTNLVSAYLHLWMLCYLKCTDQHGHIHQNIDYVNVTYGKSEVEVETNTQKKAAEVTNNDTTTGVNEVGVIVNLKEEIRVANQEKMNLEERVRKAEEEVRVAKQEKMNLEEIVRIVKKEVVELKKANTDLADHVKVSLNEAREPQISTESSNKVLTNEDKYKAIYNVLNPYLNTTSKESKPLECESTDESCGQLQEQLKRVGQKLMELKNLTDENRSLQTANKGLNDQLQLKRELGVNLTNSNESLNEQLIKMQETIQNTQQNSQELQTRIQTLTTAKSDLEDQLNTCTDRKTELMDSNNDTETQKDTLLQRQQELTDQLNESQTKNDQTVAQLKKDYDLKKNESLEKLRTIQEQLTIARKKITRSETKLKQQIETGELQDAEFDQAMQTLKKKREKLNTSYGELDEQKQAIEDENNQLVKSLKELQARLGLYWDDNISLREQVDQMTNSIPDDLLYMMRELMKKFEMDWEGNNLYNKVQELTEIVDTITEVMGELSTSFSLEGLTLRAIVKDLEKFIHDKKLDDVIYFGQALHTYFGTGNENKPLNEKADEMTKILDSIQKFINELGQITFKEGWEEANKLNLSLFGKVEVLKVLMSE
jgi:chromosome segregation ATPase